MVRASLTNKQQMTCEAWVLSKFVPKLRF